MKIRLVILSTFFIISVCHAQNGTKKRVPLLKESPEIDSLISSLLDIPGYLKAMKNDSCVELSLNSNNENFVQGLHTLNHRETIFDLGGNLENYKNMGYFEFRGYLIFVVGDAFINKFFTYTNEKKEFIFIKPEGEEALILIRGYMSWAVFYNNGKFNYGVH